MSLHLPQCCSPLPERQQLPQRQPQPDRPEWTLFVTAQIYLAFLLLSSYRWNRQNWSRNCFALLTTVMRRCQKRTLSRWLIV